MKDSLKQFYKEHSPSQSLALPPETKQRIKFSLMTKISNMSLQEFEDIAPETSNRFTVLLSKNYVVIPLVAVLLIGGTTVASANSLPGDPLYPVKRSVETFTVMIAQTEQEKTKLQVKYAEKRIVELETLEQRGAITDDIKIENKIDDKVKNESTKNSAKTTDDSNDLNKNSNDQPKTEANTKSNSRYNSKKIRKYKAISPQVQKQIKEEVNNARKFLNDTQHRSDHYQQSSTNQDRTSTESDFKIPEQPNLRFNR